MQEGWRGVARLDDPPQPTTKGEAMRVRIKKPREGKVSFVIDDLRGMTGTKRRYVGVEVAELKGTLEGAVNRWAEDREVMKAARRSLRG